MPHPKKQWYREDGSKGIAKCLHCDWKIVETMPLRKLREKMQEHLLDNVFHERVVSLVDGKEQIMSQYWPKT